MSSTTSVPSLGDDIRAVVPAVKLHNVTHRYPGSDAGSLENVTFEVSPGEFVYIVGTSGSGKSSLLRILYAEQKPQSGRVYSVGTNLQRLRNRRVHLYRRKLGVIFQDFKMLPGRRVAQQLEFALAVTGQRGVAGTRIPEVLEVVGLADKPDRLPTELSGGEIQRVAIARALVTGPELILADEPTGNLDPETGAEIMDVLGRVNAAGTTVLMATHDQRLVDQQQRRILRLEDGHLIRDDNAGGYWAGGAA